MNSYPPRTLSEACEFIVDCLHSTAPTESSGYALIRTPNIGKGRLDLDEVFRVSQSTYEVRTSRGTPEAGDLILAREAPAGNVAIIKDGERVCLGQRTVHLRPDRTKVDPDFLCYYLLAPPQQARLLAGETGATAGHVNIKDIRQLALVSLPRLQEQTRIGSILSTYDDLLENNRRRMALLEDAARQLYREWFVRLRFPGYEHTRVVDGVPDGWELRPLAGCSTFLSGGTPSKAREEFWDGDIPWASSGELTELRIRDTPLRVTQQGAQAGSRLVPRETILAVVRGMSLAKEWRIGVTARQMAFNQDLKAIVANDGIDPLLLFHCLDAQRDQVRDRAGEASHGTKKLDTAVLSGLPVLVPPHSMQQLFREHIEPLHDQWDNLHSQNVKLRTARDLLLPRLMSGEIAV